MSQPFLLKRKQAAAFLNVHPSTIHKMVQEEELPEVWFSNVSRIPLRAILEKLIEAGAYTKPEADELERKAFQDAVGAA